MLIEKIPEKYFGLLFLITWYLHSKVLPHYAVCKEMFIKKVLSPFLSVFEMCFLYDMYVATGRT